MKIRNLLIVLAVLFLVACSTPEPTIHQGAGGTSDRSVEPEETVGPDCYAEGIHPIAAGIAEDYAEITTYEEVMTWFCNGALFEDILNALTTEEITAVEADETLWQVAAGKTWNEIWLELGVTEE